MNGRNGYRPVAGLTRRKFDALFGTTGLGKGMSKNGTKVIGVWYVLKIQSLISETINFILAFSEIVRS